MRLRFWKKEKDYWRIKNFQMDAQKVYEFKSKRAFLKFCREYEFIVYETDDALTASCGGDLIVWKKPLR